MRDEETGLTVVHARAALLPEGWREGVRLTIADGGFQQVQVGARPEPGDETHALVVPTLPNVHSHTFQRAMAGLAENRGPGSDSFWTWRQLMFHFALQISPEQLEAVAAQAFMEMLEGGFGRVGEFHYLHNDRDGTPYANPAELSERIAAAAAETGIALTLLPVFYAHSGFGAAEPSEGQRRFINTLDGFGALVDACRTALGGLPGSRLGVAPHSLRAVTPDQLLNVLPLAGAGPIHIHVAEQRKEVEDCLQHLGARPVEWLVANMPVDGRWCFIHATHVTAREIAGMAGREAIAGLCPITEANLGDGVFPARDFLLAGGAFGVGSDSNVMIGAADELRQLEYSQRLLLEERNTLAPPGGSTGRMLFDRALVGGGAALAARDTIRAGRDANLLSFAGEALPYLTPDQALDCFVFTGGVRPDCVWMRGRKVVEGGRHIGRSSITGRFHAAVKALITDEGA